MQVCGPWRFDYGSRKTDPDDPSAHTGRAEQGGSLSSCVRSERTDLIEDQVQGAQSRGLHRGAWIAKSMYEKPLKLYWVYIMASRPRGCSMWA
jgi:hypothetical protein